jgi:hypothetical protein
LFLGAGANAHSAAESLCSSSLCLCGFFFSILRRRVRLKGIEKTVRDTGYFIDCGQKRWLICFRRLRETADFSHELQRSGANFFLSYGRIEVEKRFDVPAHPFDLKFEQFFRTTKTGVALKQTSF